MRSPKTEVNCWLERNLTGQKTTYSDSKTVLFDQQGEKKNSRMYFGGHSSFALLPPSPTNLLHGKDTRTYKKSPSWGSLRSSWVIREDHFLCTSISLTIFIQTPFTHIDVCVSTRSNKQIWKEARERINKYFGFKKVINQKIRWANR